MAGRNRKNLFESRFAARGEELRQLYMELYHDDKAAFDYFRLMLERCFAERPAALLELDETRQREPGWYRERGYLGMLMYAKAFAGTLSGVREKLGYLQESGVNYLHLMPLLESPAGRSDGGYAVSDFRRVDPELGTMEDLAELAEECHKRGIVLCLDFVMNHTSEDHEWARRARAGEREFQERYLFFDDWSIPSEYEKTVPQVFPPRASSAAISSSAPSSA